MNRGYSLLTVKSIDGGESDDFIVKGVATTPSPDREGDIMEPLGMSFKNPLALLWQHRQREPVGTVVFDTPTKDGITFTARLPRIKEAGRLKDRIEEAIQSIKSGIVRAVSVGFKAKEAERLQDGGFRILKSEVLELSLVTIPANEEATIYAAKSIDGNTLAALGATIVNEEVAETVPVTTKNAKENTRMTIEERLAALALAVKAKQARMTTLSTKSADASETMDAESGSEFDALDAEIGALEVEIKRLTRMQELTAGTARPIAGNSVKAASAARSEVIVKTPKTLEKGIGMAQFAIALAAGKGNLMQSAQIAETRFKDNDELNIAMKAAVAAGTTTDPTWAAPLVDSYQRFSGDFVEFLRPQTIVGRFGTGNIPSLRRVPFNVSIPAQTSGGEAYWTGEGAGKGLTKFDFAEVTLRWAKVANIAVLTEELLRFSNPAAEVLVRDSLAAALIARLDIDFIDPAKAEVPNVSPASITNGVTAIVSTGSDADAVRADIKALFGAFIAANNAPNTGVFLMSAVRALALSLMLNPLGQSEFPGLTMAGGVLFGLPVIVSQYVASDTVVLLNASDILLADDGVVTIDASREVSLQMDTAPTQASGATAVPTPVVSMWQTNSVAVRAERWITWKRRRTTAVALLSGVTWGDPTTP